MNQPDPQKPEQASPTQPLPCPHGRLPMNGEPGYKHCPHCLGVNDSTTGQWERFSWIHKLAPYELNFTCDQDCKFTGCPSHIAKFELHNVTDTYTIQFGDDELIGLDNERAGMLLEFLYRLNSNSGAFLKAKQEARAEMVKEVLDKIENNYIYSNNPYDPLNLIDQLRKKYLKFKNA